MKIFLICVVILCSILNGCAGVSDTYEDLFNGYTYESESKNQKVIMKNPLSIDSNLYIPSTVLDYEYNKNYIVAKIIFHYDMNDGTVGFKESKRLKEGKNYYYIIDTVRNVRYGEFSDYHKFVEKLKKLKVDLHIEK